MDCDDSIYSLSAQMKWRVSLHLARWMNVCLLDWAVFQCLPESQVKLEDDTMKFFVELHLYQRGMCVMLQKIKIPLSARIFSSVQSLSHASDF